MKGFFLSFVFVTSLFGCSTKETAEPASVTIFYAETQCADPWLRTTSTSVSGFVPDNVRIPTIIEYLKSNKVPSARNARIKDAPPGTFLCQACTCLSGRTVEVTINESDWEQAQKLGFKR